MCGHRNRSTEGVFLLMLSLRKNEGFFWRNASIRRKKASFPSEAKSSEGLKIFRSLTANDAKHLSILPEGQMVHYFLMTSKSTSRRKCKKKSRFDTILQAERPKSSKACRMVSKRDLSLQCCGGGEVKFAAYIKSRPSSKQFTLRCRYAITAPTRSEGLVGHVCWW